MLVYVNKAKWYFNLPQNEISFDAIEDYYLYNIIFEKLNAESEFKMGIESWVYYEQANVYKNLIFHLRFYIPHNCGAAFFVHINHKLTPLPHLHSDFPAGINALTALFDGFVKKKKHN